MSDLITVLITDDHAIVREGLRLILETAVDIEVIGEAADGAEALQLVAQQPPDVVLMDLRMPGMDGLTAIEHLQRDYPQVAIVILTTYNEDDLMLRGLQAGAKGFLLKDTPRAEVVEAIRGTVAGRAYVDPAVTSKLLRQVADNQTQPATTITAKLSEREVDVLRLLARGYTNGDIAGALHLSEGTVRNHVSAIFAKLEVGDRTQAAIIAIQHGLGNL